MEVGSNVSLIVGTRPLSLPLTPIGTPEPLSWLRRHQSIVDIEVTIPGISGEPMESGQGP